LELKQQGKTIFITTHLMGDVEQLCDKVIFMKKGQVTNASSPRDLKIQYGKQEVTLEYLNNGSTTKKIFDLADLGKNPDFLATLNQYQIETIHSGETSLEEIFIKITGDNHEESR